MSDELISRKAAIEALQAAKVDSIGPPLPAPQVLDWAIEIISLPSLAAPVSGQGHDEPQNVEYEFEVGDQVTFRCVTAFFSPFVIRRVEGRRVQLFDPGFDHNEWYDFDELEPVAAPVLGGDE